MLLELIFNRFYNEEPTGPTPKEPTETQETTEGENSTEKNEETSKESKPFKVYTTEEEYQKELKSAQSKAKNEILQKLGVNSVDKATSSLTEAEQMKKDLQLAMNKMGELEEKTAVAEANIAEDYRQDALTLAKSKVNDNTTLADALKQVVERYPNFSNQPKDTKKGVEKVGGDRSKENSPKGEDQLAKELSSKYSWLKF